MTDITNAWDEVRSAYGRAAQMAVQTVEAYAAIGDMLIRLKDETAHGEFLERCAHALGEKNMACSFSDAQLQAARVKAGRYMRLADNRTAWLPHNPQSLNEAMKLLPKRATERPSEDKPQEEPVRNADGVSVGMQITKMMSAAGVNALNPKANRGVIKHVHAALGVKALSELDMDDPKTYEAVRGCVADEAGLSSEEVEKRLREDISALSQKDKRRVEKLEEQLRSTFIAEVQRGVQEEYKRTQADLVAEMVAERDGYMKKYLALATMKASMTAILTEDDYRFLLNVLHPDRAPEDRREKFARAFDIVRKLDPYIQAVKA